MCGIAGYKNNRSLNHYYNIRYALSSLKHRGPDEAGYFKNKFFTLINTRLSIQDKKNGQQPFMENSNYCLIYNGEIYNFKELNQKLKKKKIKIKTNSDTELLYYLLIHFGKKILNDINGQFAFCFYDLKANKLLIARDRFSEKPLYFYFNAKNFIFASEIKTIVGLKNTSIQIDKNEITSKIFFWSTTPGNTVFKDIKILEPGYYIELKKNILKKKKFYRDKQFKTKNIKKEVEKSIIKKLIGEEKISLSLSGGIDSTIIASVLSRNNSLKNSFSINFKEKNFDEKKFQTCVAQRYKLKNNGLLLDNNTLLKNLQLSTIYSEDINFRLGYVASYLFYKFIKKNNFKVVIGGEGADELFWGYDVFYDNYVKILFKKGGNKKEAYNIAKQTNLFLKNSKSYRRFNDLKIRILKNDSNKKNPLDFCFAQKFRLAQFSNNFLNDNSNKKLKIVKNKFVKYIKNKYQNISSINLLRLSQILETETLLFNHLIPIQADKMAMSNSIEVRSGFLDNNLYSYSNDMNYKEILKNLDKKNLKKNFNKDIPKIISNRKKFPFRSPDSIILFKKGKMNSKIKNIIKKALIKQNIFNKAKTLNFIDKIQDKEINPSVNLFLNILVTYSIIKLTFNKVYLKKFFNIHKKLYFKDIELHKNFVLKKVINW